MLIAGIGLNNDVQTKEVRSMHDTLLKVVNNKRKDVQSKSTKDRLIITQNHEYKFKSEFLLSYKLLKSSLNHIKTSSNVPIWSVREHLKILHISGKWCNVVAFTRTKNDLPKMLLTNLNLKRKKGGVREMPPH